MSSLMAPLAGAFLSSIGRPGLLVGVGVMRRRGRGAQQDVVRTVGAKDHLQQLREVFLVGNVVVVLEDVEQVVGLKAVTELLDRLGTDAIDAQQILLGLTNRSPTVSMPTSLNLLVQRCDTPSRRTGTGEPSRQRWCDRCG